MDFEWDDNKERKNSKYHNGVSFEDAMLVFNDPERIERFDDTHSGDEERWQTIGAVGELLFVVYTERENATRILSARFANTKEGNGIMAIIKRTLTAGTKPTLEQLARLREAAKYPIVYTEDCPELTEEQLAEFRPINGMTWEERAQAMREAIGVGG